MQMRLKIIGFILLSLTLTSCVGSNKAATQAPEDINLVFYGLFDNSEIFTPMIEAYEAENPNTHIQYKKFTNPNDYWDLVLNELAEGEGPDIFMLHNTWMPKHYKKLAPAPDHITNSTEFRSQFAKAAAQDLIIPNESGIEQVLGLPIYIDNLAIYYNSQHFEEAFPSRPEPSSTWSKLTTDAATLSKEDNSFERFERAGIAMGRPDNILRTFDTMLMLFLQHEVDFYTSDLKKVILSSQPASTAAMELLTSFSLPSRGNYSWNSYLAQASSQEKEITTFAKGKVSMILGYSYTYNDILDEINRLKQNGISTINIDHIKISTAPQINESTTAGPVTYASYFTPVVSRNSDHSEEAWKFLISLSSDENLRYYFEKTHHPSSKISLLNEQALDPIYGVFAEQVKYAKSIPMSDAKKYEEIILNGIAAVLETKSPETVILEIETALQELIPKNGIKATKI